MNKDWVSISIDTEWFFRSTEKPVTGPSYPFLLIYHRFLISSDPVTRDGRGGTTKTSDEIGVSPRKVVESEWFTPPWTEEG